MTRQPFGRRTPPANSQTIAPLVPRPGRLHTGRADPVPNTNAKLAEDRSLDDELSEWKKERRKNYRLPWRQISLMASACFSIAYFVLPDSVNHVVQWLLLALGILSFVSSISPRAASPSRKSDYSAGIGPG